MKAVCRIAYWVLAIALVTVILLSLDYTLTQALLISLAFCPCAILLEWLLPKARGTMQKIYAFALVLVVTVLLILILHRLLWSPFMKSKVWSLLDVQPVLINPVFLGLLLSALVFGDIWWSKWLAARFADKPRPVTFFSDRKSVTLDVREIAFVESNDTEVRLVTTDGRSFRNKTRIGQWEDLLGEGFVRIHRSYLVNRACIEEVGSDFLVVAGISLPVSRKYRKLLPVADGL